MKQIDVRDQVSLSFARCLELTVRGIRYRLFRSLITVVIVALAVAFLMMMLSTSYIDRTVGADIRSRTSAQRRLAEWVDKLTVPMNDTSLAQKISAARPLSSAWQEIRAWGGLTDEQVQTLQNVGKTQQEYERFLAKLKPGERSSLVGSREGAAVFDFLSVPPHLDEFLKGLKNVRGNFPGDKAHLESFLKDFHDTADLRQKVLKGHALAVESLKKELGARHVTEIFGSDSRQTQDVLKRSGFIVEAQELAMLQKEAQAEVDAARLVGLLRNKYIRGAIARQMNLQVSELMPAHVFKIASTAKGAAWLKEQVDLVIQQNEKDRQVTREKMRAEGKSPQEIDSVLASNPDLIEPLDLPTQRMVDVSAGKIWNEQLAGLESKLPQPEDALYLGFSSTTGWLIIISFLVCVVGVANAMLMSVTERFREIATMKCLGALDSFIMFTFVLESSLQGLAGGLAGVLLGLILGILHSLWGFGWLTLSNLPGAMLGFSALGCLGAGVVLAAMAAVYPAWVAARLAPMEAMRIE